MAKNKQEVEMGQQGPPGTAPPPKKGKGTQERDYGKPLPYDPEFKGPMGKRSCTDICCCFTFLIAIVGFIIIACFGFAKGDPRRMVYPLDQFGQFCGIGNQSARPYLYNPDITNTSGGDCVAQCPNGSTIVLGRCLPFNASNPMFQELLGSTLGSVTNLVSRSVADLTNTWWLILIFVFAAMILSFIWICLLRCFAGFLVWLSILGVLGALGAVTALVFWQGSEKAIAATNNPSQNSMTDAYIIYAIGGVLALIWVIILFIIFAMCGRIRLAIQILKETSRAVGSMVLIVFLPVWMFIIIALVAVAWLASVLFVLSSGTITVNGANRSFHLSWPMRYLAIYCLFFFFWMMWFIRGMTQLTIAGAISTWYFTREDDKGKKKIPGHPIVRAFGWGVRYHMGSVAFGAAIIAIVATIRAILAYLQKKFKNSTNKCMQFCMSCLQCCLWCFQKILEYISKNAYIMIAIHSKNFCRSAKNAFCLLMRNILRMAAVNAVGDFVIYLGKVFIVSLCAGATLIAIRPEWINKSLADILPQFTVTYWWVPVLFVAVVAFIVSSVFLSVYSFGIDTILLCFCEDCERHKNIGRQAAFASKDLQDYMHEVKKMQIEELNRFRGPLIEDPDQGLAKGDGTAPPPPPQMPPPGLSPPPNVGSAFTYGAQPYAHPPPPPGAPYQGAPAPYGQAVNQQ